VYNRSDYSNLIELLEPFSSSLCFEVRDKIYGLVGLARDATDFRIDYSLSLYDIFIDVMGLQDKEDCALLMACSQFIQRLLKEEVGKSAHENSHSLERLFGALAMKRALPKWYSSWTRNPQCSKQSLRRKIFSCNRAKIGDGILNYFCNGKEMDDSPRECTLLLASYLMR